MEQLTETILEANAWSTPLPPDHLGSSSSSPQLKDSSGFYTAASQPQTLTNVISAVHRLQEKYARYFIYLAASKKTDVMLVFKE